MLAKIQSSFFLITLFLLIGYINGTANASSWTPHNNMINPLYIFGFNLVSTYLLIVLSVILPPLGIFFVLRTIYKIGFATGNAISTFKLPVFTFVTKSSLHGLGEVIVLMIVLFYGFQSALFLISHFSKKNWISFDEFIKLTGIRLLKETPVVIIILLISAFIEMYYSHVNFINMVG